MDNLDVQHPAFEGGAQVVPTIGELVKLKAGEHSGEEAQVALSQKVPNM